MTDGITVAAAARLDLRAGTHDARFPGKAACPHRNRVVNSLSGTKAMRPGVVLPARL
jgi:hypothetical protein